MKHLFILILICGFISPSTFEVFAQDTQSTTTNNTKYVRLILQNGGMYEGEVLEIDESSFLINLQSYCYPADRINTGAYLPVLLHLGSDLNEP